MRKQTALMCITDLSGRWVGTVELHAGLSRQDAALSGHKARNKGVSLQCLKMLISNPEFPPGGWMN